MIGYGMHTPARCWDVKFSTDGEDGFAYVSISMLRANSCCPLDAIVYLAYSDRQLISFSYLLVGIPINQRSFFHPSFPVIWAERLRTRVEKNGCKRRTFLRILA